MPVNPPSSSKPILPRLALILWTLAIVIVCMRSALSEGGHSVWSIFAEAGQDWIMARDLYEFHEGEQSGPYRYSPTVAMVLAPLSLLPTATGGVVWRLLCAGVLLGGLWLWSRRLLEEGPERTLSAGLFLLTLPLMIGNLNNGQSNPLVLGLLLTGAACLSRDRWAILAGPALATAVLIKGYPLAMVLLLATVAPWRFLGWILLALLIGLALPFVFQRPDYVVEQYQGWWHHLQTSDRDHLPMDLWYRDARLLLANGGVLLDKTSYTCLQLAAGAAMAGVCLLLKRQGEPRERLLTLATGLGCVWMTVLGPSTESATYILLAPAAVWSVMASFRRKSETWRLAPRTLSLAGYGLLVLSQIAVWFPQGRSWHTLGLQPLAGLLVLGGLLGLAWPKLVRGRGATAGTVALAPLQ